MEIQSDHLWKVLGTDSASERRKPEPSDSPEVKHQVRPQGAPSCPEQGSLCQDTPSPRYRCSDSAEHIRRFIQTLENPSGMCPRSFCTLGGEWTCLEEGWNQAFGSEGSTANGPPTCFFPCLPSTRPCPALETPREARLASGLAAGRGT